ncbi:hypothetical protein RCG24_05270 [Neobacillus sp. OS1-32]|uniref:Uncharacterized protein n=1 Tax=Neobacillus paridis TaxID=2803862 RepID=A0ABS1TI78_9BACI|nr:MULTISPECIES: hypothetical protein [Neobacillus]MBL4950734.1 hypothetical protein [Neobacillus paridis]WML31287.1 hypothetical protein RCG24_05270 [Neobacillus sp. OS1-32]
MGRMKKFLLTSFIAIILICGIIVSSYGTTIFQEGNPIPLLVSVTKLHFTNCEYVEFAKTEKRIRFISINKMNDQYKMVKTWMSSKGWDYKEKMGSGLIFTKNGEDAVVEVRPYTSNYFVWEIQKPSFGNT